MDFSRISGETIEGYRAQMDGEVLPYLMAREQSGYYETLPGQKLFYEYYEADRPRGLVVLLHGFSEGIGKHRESIARFLQAGFSVWVLQQREHGKSYRSTDNASLIHITDFKQMARDVHGFLHRVVLKEKSSRDLPRVIYGHSMGGGVSTVCLEAYPDDFQYAVLSSPMLGMKSGVPVPLAAVYADVMLLCGRGKNPIPGAKPFSGEWDYAHSHAGCEARYDYWFREVKAHAENQMCVSTNATARQFLALTRYATKKANCSRVKAKVLLLSAGADTAVDNQGQDRFVHQLPGGARLVRFDGQRHELYLGDDTLVHDYWENILTFLAEVGDNQ